MSCSFRYTLSTSKHSASGGCECGSGPSALVTCVIAVRYYRMHCRCLDHIDSSFRTPRALDSLLKIKYRVSLLKWYPAKPIQVPITMINVLDMSWIAMHKFGKVSLFSVPFPGSARGWIVRLQPRLPSSLAETVSRVAGSPVAPGLGSIAHSYGNVSNYRTRPRSLSSEALTYQRGASSRSTSCSAFYSLAIFTPQTPSGALAVSFTRTETPSLDIPIPLVLFLLYLRSNELSRLLVYGYEFSSERHHFIVHLFMRGIRPTDQHDISGSGKL
ncbi:hypothetical protein KQX54_006238 [Cotesia glomerata]|uniref:Uncharacterized protein n=1 Tax=Cotesia glomerata TaxID=32391 RepID=A0AAV7I5J2_COTGL|nr:hypothetical protein KQX54_006238 [Cotesia glomerata]